MNVGIVGAEAAKFTVAGELEARRLIGKLLADQAAVLVSGGCHLGGVDIWAEEAADALGRPKIIHRPAELNWSQGFRPRNLLIAQDSTEIHNIVVRSYPANYQGMRFEFCYHCRSNGHVKSGGCWTAKYAKGLGKVAYWHVVQNEEERRT